MTYQMVDSISPDCYPDPPPDAVAAYDDGRWPDWQAVHDRFPNTPALKVTVNPNDNEGQCLDVENGDATPAQAPPWVVRARARGVDPWVYCSFSAWASVRQAFASANVAQPHYWIADYDGQSFISQSWADMGCIAKQWRSDTNTNRDFSVLLDTRYIAAAPLASPALAGSDLMEIIMAVAKSDTDAARGLVRWIWASFTHDEPTGDTLNTLALNGVENGFEALVTGILDAQKVQEVRAVEDTVEEQEAAQHGLANPETVAQ